MTASEFSTSLRRGQLVYANNIAVQKTHIVELIENAYEEQANSFRALRPRLGDEEVNRRIARLSEDKRGMWSASALCGVRGERTAWGNKARYYWHPDRSPSMRNICRGCRTAWRRRGEPKIQGWDTSGTANDPWPWPLPFGWREIPADTHPWDVPADRGVDQVRDATGKVVGEHRVELRRFRRGKRIVRLVHDPKADIYYARCWSTGGDPALEHWTHAGTLANARRGCQELMARGGY